LSINNAKYALTNVGPIPRVLVPKSGLQFLDISSVSVISASLPRQSARFNFPLYKAGGPVESRCKPRITKKVICTPIRLSKH